jgi:hypothetical protein
MQEIRSAYAQKKNWEKQFPLNYFLIRPLSFYLTYITLRVTRDPAKIAIFGFALGVIGCFLLASSSIWSIWPGILLIFLFSILDAVDGNVARTTNNVTLFGKYLDGLLGDLIYGSYPFFLGVGLYFSADRLPHHLIETLPNEHLKALPLFFGSVVLISHLWAASFETRFDNYRLQKEGCAPSSKTNLSKPIAKSRRSEKWYYLIFINIDCLNNQLLLFVILSFLKLEIFAILFLACFFTTKAFFYLIFYYRKSNYILK